MQKDTRILQLIHELKRNIDSDWTEALDRINIWHEIEPLYTHIDNRVISNTIFAFIVLAYDAESEFLEPLKDRITNKRSIMIRLAGKDCFKKEIYTEAVLGDSYTGEPQGIIDKTIQWYIDQQRDRRWGKIISGFEFDSKATALASGASDMDGMKEAGTILDSAKKRLEDATKLLEEIRREFVDLDTVLEKEDKLKVTDRLKNDPTNWEMFIHRTQMHKAKMERLEKEMALQKDVITLEE